MSKGTGGIALVVILGFLGWQLLKPKEAAAAAPKYLPSGGIPVPSEEYFIPLTSKEKEAFKTGTRPAASIPVVMVDPIAGQRIAVLPADVEILVQEGFTVVAGKGETTGIAAKGKYRAVTYDARGLTLSTEYIDTLPAGRQSTGGGLGRIGNTEYFLA